MRSRPEGTHLLRAGQGVYAISVAAEPAGIGVQTLRLYEQHGLIGKGSTLAYRAHPGPGRCRHRADRRTRSAARGLRQLTRPPTPDSRPRKICIQGCRQSLSVVVLSLSFGS